MPSSIYLDNSATTRVRPEVQEAMNPYAEDKWGNPSSVHFYGVEARRALDDARRSVAGMLGCDEDEVYFTPCGTYSNNVALLGRARFNEANGKGKHLITTRIEHSSCMGPAKYLEGAGWDVTYLPVDCEGFVDPDALRKAIKKETSIISIMWANNEVGSVQPLKELADIARAADVFFHSDAVQVPGKLKIDVKDLGVDSLAISGHKFYAPKGIGALYVRKGSNVMPLVFGGGQERGLFPGTEPVAAAVAIGVASKLAAQELVTETESLIGMGRILVDGLTAIEGVKLSGPQTWENRIPGHVSVILPGLEGEAMVMQADLRGLCISSASACKKGVTRPSHVVTALCFSDAEAVGSIRMSAGRFNTEDECVKAVDLMGKIIGSLRKSTSGSGAPSETRQLHTV